MCGVSRDVQWTSLVSLLYSQEERHSWYFMISPRNHSECLFLLSTAPITPGFSRHISLLSEGVIDWISLEVDRDILSGQFLVDGLDNFDFVLQEVAVASVQGDLDGARTVDSDSSSLGDDGAWSDQILQNSVMDGSKGSGAWSHLRFVDLEPFGLDSAFSSDNNWHLELLLEFWNQFLLTSLGKSLQGSEWNDDDGSFAGLSLDWKLEVMDTVDLNILEQCLVVTGIHDFGEGLTDRFLEIRSWALGSGGLLWLGFLDLFGG